MSFGDVYSVGAWLKSATLGTKIIPVGALQPITFNGAFYYLRTTFSF